MDYLALLSIGLLSIGLLSIDSSVLKLRKLCAELISCFDLFAMPAKKHKKAAVPTTEVPKSNEVAKHVIISLPQSSADAIQRTKIEQ